MSDDGGFFDRTLVNTVANVVKTVVMAIIGVMMVPYYLDVLGMSTYAVIPLAATMTSYVMIMAESLTEACSRYSIMAVGTGDRKEALKTFNSAFFGILRVCAILVPVIIALSYASPYVFNVGPNAAADVQILFLSVLTSSLIVVVTSSFSFVFDAFNRMSHLFITKMLYSVIQVLGVFLLFSLGTPSLVDVGVSYLVSAAVFFILTFALAKRTYPVLRIRRPCYDGGLFKKMGSLGAWTIAQKVGGLLYIQASIVLVNVFVGEEAGGGFAIVASLVSMMHTASYSLTVSLEPSIYRLYSDGDMEGLRSLLRTFVKLVALLFAMPTAFLLVFAPDVMTVWVGEENVGLGELFRVAMVGDVAVCASTVVECVPIVMLKMRKITGFTILAGLVNIALSAVIMWAGGGSMSAMCVWAVCITSLALFTLAYVGGIAGTSLLPRLGVGYAIWAVCLAAYWLASAVVDLGSGWLILFVAAIVAAVIHLFIVSRLLDRDEKDEISKYVPGSVRKYLDMMWRRRSSLLYRTANLNADPSP
ncbi:MAG: hypothetical protein J5674_06210 [Candidatus Methanomethylophilaceae archaeon]|nr:hypothetical protein [Candidatus Methanomethylophilaceae archaeon]